MLTLTCNNCGKTSENPYDFGNINFSYIDVKNTLHFCHLCKDCQKKLDAVLEKAIAVFLKEAKVTSWQMKEGIYG